MTVDIPAQIGAVKREVRKTQRDGRPTRIVIATRTLDTTVEDLWDALTNADRIPRWFAPVTGDLKLGGRYQLQDNAGGTITTCDRPRELAMTWEFGGGVSWLDVSLKPERKGARLELRHTASPDAHWEEYGAGAVGIGWELSLMGLGLHLKDPKGGQLLAGNAQWQTTEEGKRFMRASGDAWGKAEVAGGADRKLAQAAAERAKKFYCGEQ